MHAILHPQKYNVFNVQDVIGMPPPKLFKYYQRSDVRGYLSNTTALRDFVPDAEKQKTLEQQELFLQQYLKEAKKGSSKKN